MTPSPTKCLRTSCLRRCLDLVTGFIVTLSTAANGQISLTCDFLPFEIGHERVYATHSSATTNVTGRTGSDGGPQLWDFTTGPGNETYSYRNFAPANSPSPGSFPTATIAEKLSITSTGQNAFTYYAKNARGRELLGFFDGLANPEYPLVILDSPLADFPPLITFGTQWSDTTTFQTRQLLLGSPTDVDVILHIDSRVDAYGTMRLPGLGEIEVLRVNELDRQETTVYFGGQPIVLPDTYVRVLFWISRDYGIVAQITSEAGEQIPPTDTLTTASRFLRLIDFRNPAPLEAVIEPFGNNMVKLSWNAQPGVQDYAIESTTTLLQNQWLPWATTDSTSITAPVDSPFRAFRVKPATP